MVHKPSVVRLDYRLRFRESGRLRNFEQAASMEGDKHRKAAKIRIEISPCSDVVRSCKCIGCSAREEFENDIT